MGTTLPVLPESLADSNCHKDCWLQGHHVPFSSMPNGQHALPPPAVTRAETLGNQLLAVEGSSEDKVSAIV